MNHKYRKLKIADHLKKYIEDCHGLHTDIFKKHKLMKMSLKIATLKHLNQFIKKIFLLFWEFYISGTSLHFGIMYYGCLNLLLSQNWYCWHFWERNGTEWKWNGKWLKMHYIFKFLEMIHFWINVGFICVFLIISKAGGYNIYNNVQERYSHFYKK